MLDGIFKKMPTMEPVDSSCVQAIGYDPQTLELHVQFLETKRTYVYCNVSELTYHAMMTSPSKGRFLNSDIKPYHEFYPL